MAFKTQYGLKYEVFINYCQYNILSFIINSCAFPTLSLFYLSPVPTEICSALGKFILAMTKLAANFPHYKKQSAPHPLDPPCSLSTNPPFGALHQLCHHKSTIYHHSYYPLTIVQNKKTSTKNKTRHFHYPFPLSNGAPQTRPYLLSLQHVSRHNVLVPTNNPLHQLSHKIPQTQEGPPPHSSISSTTPPSPAIRTL